MLNIFAALVLFFIAVKYAARAKSTSAMIAFLSLCVLVIVLEILLFAGAYLTFGATSGWWESVYFSVVTFTTLGYGDIQPLGVTRLFAALEALIGYFIFGLFVAVCYRAISITSQKSS